MYSRKNVQCVSKKSLVCIKKNVQSVLEKCSYTKTGRITKFHEVEKKNEKTENQ